MNCINTLSYFAISLENEQLFAKNTKILNIILFSLIHKERRLIAQEAISEFPKPHFQNEAKYKNFPVMG